MVEKIFFLLLLSISVKDRKLKWRVKRMVMGFLPPPGGPMAHAKLTSTRYLKAPSNHQEKFGVPLIYYEKQITVTVM